jgi:hypothetical protein
MQAVIDFVMSHQVVLAGVVVAIIDLAMALSPSLASNGILHSVYLFLKKIVSPAA